MVIERETIYEGFSSGKSVIKVLNGRVENFFRQTLLNLRP